MDDDLTLGARASRIFFMRIGGLVAVIVYFVLCGAGEYSAEAVRQSLLIALLVHTAFVVLAYRFDEPKQFDVGLWLMFAAGTAAAWLGPDFFFELYRQYSPAILFATLALITVVPPLFGYERFTAYFNRRLLPRWQQKLPVTESISRAIAHCWTILFVVAALLCAYAPLDWRFTLLYPNALVWGVGMSASWWLPRLYLRMFPLGPPTSVEAVIMGMPIVFDPRAAGDARVEIQFRVTGEQAGAYWLRIADGRCRSFEGAAPRPDLVVHTPGDVWLGIVRGELDGAKAFADDVFSAEGDVGILTKFASWFPDPSPTAVRPQ